jgi:hypothetical protein
MVFTLAVKSFENQKTDSSILFMPQSGICVNARDNKLRSILDDPTGATVDTPFVWYF